MNGVANISRNVGQAWGTVAWLFLIAYFAVHAFQGDSSLAALKELDLQHVSLKAEAQSVLSERQALEMKVSKMGGSEIDPDMLEELVRKNLGFTHPDEVVVLIK